MTRTLARLAAIGPVAADPYPWPYDGTVTTDRVALICIDWQVDFCGPGGYVDRMGYDIEGSACPARHGYCATPGPPGCW